MRPCFQGLRAPFLTHHVVLNLGFTFDHSSRCSRVLSPHAWCCTSFTLFLGTFTARLVLFHSTPVSLVLHASCGPWCEALFPRGSFHRTLVLHVLRVVWWSPAPPLFSLPRAARVGRYLQSSAAPAVVSQTTSCFTVAESCFSLSLSSMCWASHVSFSCTAARWPSTHAVEFCECPSSSEGSCQRLMCGSVFL